MEVDNSREILKNCPNFTRIVNFDYAKDDLITAKLIRIYRDYIFKIDISNEEEVENAVEIDKIMVRYIDDYLFRKTLKQELLRVKVKSTCKDIIKTIVESIIEIFRRVEFESTRKIYISKWI